MVFAGLYPIEPNQYEALRDALEKLRLNDSSFFYEPETSLASGIWVSLRLSWSLTYGNCPGAPGT